MFLESSSMPEQFQPDQESEEKHTSKLSNSHEIIEEPVRQTQEPPPESEKSKPKKKSKKHKKDKKKKHKSPKEKYEIHDSKSYYHPYPIGQSKHEKSKEMSNDENADPNMESPNLATLETKKPIPKRETKVLSYTQLL